MSKYNPSKHHRRSIRLKGYDYAKAGLYFVTICLQNRECLFGKIERDSNTGQTANKLYDSGKMIEKWYKELENKFPDIKCHEMIVMPNHFHCIIEITPTPVGADLRVCPKSVPPIPVPPKSNNNKTTPHNNNPNNNETTANENSKRVAVLGEHIGSPLHRVVQWFKTMTTNEYIRGVKNKNWKRFDGKLWQRNYYEHIIRNEKSYRNISQYIINNPSNWKTDKFNSNQ